jgi:hypothetical protein
MIMAAGPMHTSYLLSLDPLHAARAGTSSIVAATWGLQLLGDAGGSRGMEEQPAVAWSAERLPDTACSRQFTFTMLLKVNPTYVSGRCVGRHCL